MAVPSLPTDSAVSTVSLGELLVGVQFADDAHRIGRQRFFDTILQRATILPFDVVEAREYARLFAELARKGYRIGDRDLMIAATAMAHGMPVATLNRAEFERVPGLVVADLPAPNV
jgi:tRNA(fMet)-specific endonuclease VapC